MHFDSLGRHTRINPPPFDTSEFKLVYIREKLDNDSLITAISFWKFSHGLDTAVIKTKRFDLKGRMIEEKSRISKRNAREIDDDVNAYSYHYKYNYDDQNRLVYYHKFGIVEEYHIITYTFYGKLTEVYNGNTNKLKERRMKWIKEEDGVMTITFDRKQITLVPIEKGSKLIKIIGIAQSADNAYLNFHEVSYK